jgi:hypothetical protein
MEFKVKVPFETVFRLNKILESLEVAQQKDVELLRKKIECNPVKKNLDQQQTLVERGRRISVHYLLRALVLSSIDAHEAKPEALLALMADDTVKVGRPGGSRAA